MWRCGREAVRRRWTGPGSRSSANRGPQKEKPLAITDERHNFFDVISVIWMIPTRAASPHR